MTTYAYLVEMARRSKVALAVSADVVVIYMLPVRRRVDSKMRPIAIIARLTDLAAATIAEMIKQSAPGAAIEIASDTLVMVSRVADVLAERVVSSIRSIATIAEPAKCERTEGV